MRTAGVMARQRSMQEGADFRARQPAERPHRRGLYLLRLFRVDQLLERSLRRRPDRPASAGRWNRRAGRDRHRDVPTLAAARCSTGPAFGGSPVVPSSRNEARRIAGSGPSNIFTSRSCPMSSRGALSRRPPRPPPPPASLTARPQPRPVLAGWPSATISDSGVDVRATVSST